MIGQRLDAPETHVGERADRQRYLLSGQTADQAGVLHAADAVIDALDPEHIEGFPHIRRRALLAGVGDAAQPGGGTAS